MRRSSALQMLTSVLGAWLFASCGGGGSTSSPTTPSNVVAKSGVQSTTVSWDPVAGATSYNLYYSNSSGVTKVNGTKIANVTSPYQHTGLSAGTYYYLVTAIVATGDETESIEVSAPVNLLAFVTSNYGNADLGGWSDANGQTGTAAGDTICQARATAANLNGDFRAWLSDSTSDAYCRVHGHTGKKTALCGQSSLPASAGPWVRTGDGLPFSSGIAPLVNDGVVFATTHYDESGDLSSARYFTGTNPDGTFQTANTDCGGWANGGSGTVGLGNSHGGTEDWTAYAMSYCSSVEHLLCLQTDAGPALPSFIGTGKKVFLTSLDHDGNFGGITGADAFCQTRATAAALTGTFKAWLSDGTADAISRLSSNGPWLRLDGAVIAESKSDLTGGTLVGAINVDETGKYWTGAAVWTGSTANGTMGSNTCTNWADNAYSVNGDSGVSSMSDSDWTAYGVDKCESTARLYCFED